MKHIARIAAEKWRAVVIIGVVFVVLYYALLLAALLIKFQQAPNYYTWYDWPQNVRRIVDSTPSARDTLMIIKDEWLFEVGFMNYDFGMGISEWSLFVSPFKVMAVFFLGTMLAMLYFLFREQVLMCPRSKNRLTLNNRLIPNNRMTRFQVITAISLRSE